MALLTAASTILSSWVQGKESGPQCWRRSRECATRCQVAIKLRDAGLHYFMQHCLHSMHLVYPLFGMVRPRNKHPTTRTRRRDRDYTPRFLAPATATGPLSVLASRTSRGTSEGRIRASATWGMKSRSIGLMPSLVAWILTTYDEDTSPIWSATLARTGEGADRGVAREEYTAEWGRIVNNRSRRCATRPNARRAATFVWNWTIRWTTRATTPSSERIATNTTSI